MKKHTVLLVTMCVITCVLAGGGSFGGKFPGFPGKGGWDKEGGDTQIQPGICLDSKSGKSYQKTFNITNCTSPVTVNFDVKTKAKSIFQKTVVLVKWNGKLVYAISPADNGKTVTLSLIAKQGKNILLFTAAGKGKDPVCSVCLQNIEVLKKVCYAAWGTNLVQNGDFETSDCTGTCKWTKSNITATNLPGWIPNPEIQVSTGSVYNPVLGSSRVSELDANNNTCIEQSIALKTGKTRIEFDWAGRCTVPFASLTFDVKINGKTIKSFTPKDYNLHSETIEFTIKKIPAGSSTLAFCGTGTNESFGSAIDNVVVTQYDTCATYDIIKL